MRFSRFSKSENSFFIFFLRVNGLDPLEEQSVYLFSKNEKFLSCTVQGMST